MWLRPHAVIAKVGTRSHSTEALTLEHGISTELAAAGAPIAPPVEHVAPVVDEETALLVTLWRRLDHDDRDVSAENSARVLALLHEYLARYTGGVPSFKEKLDQARLALADDALMAALPVRDRSMLRAAVDRYRADVDAIDYTERTLHGEPHSGNLLSTPNGLRWIDLEGVCRGPLEWDLAFLDEEVASFFPGSRSRPSRASPDPQQRAGCHVVLVACGVSRDAMACGAPSGEGQAGRAIRRRGEIWVNERQRKRVPVRPGPSLTCGFSRRGGRI